MKYHDVGSILSVKIGKLSLRNPLMLASGVMGISQKIFERLYEEGIGGVVTKSISLLPRTGYENPTIVPLGHGSYLNAVGLTNPGAEAFSSEISSNRDVPIIVSLVGSSEEDFPQLVNYFDSLNIIGYEINLSCPHVKKMGLDIGDDPEMVSKIVKAVKRGMRKPVIVKVGIGSADVVEISRVAVKAGADIITAINTIRAMTIEVDSMTPVLSNKIGGLSGAAIKPVGVRAVYEITKNINVPVIGCGGISSWRDVIEYMLAGASAVQFGSILGKRDPNFFTKITNNLIKYVKEKKSDNIMEIIGLGCRS